MNFDRMYLNHETFTLYRLRRDAVLRDNGIDPENFKAWQRMMEVGNECDTDEYRETQPSKGLDYVVDFMRDWNPGVDACNEMMELVKKWIDAGANMGEAYSGAAELVPILNGCFDFIWERGGHSLYTSIDQLPEPSEMAYYKGELS